MLPLLPHQGRPAGWVTCNVLMVIVCTKKNPELRNLWQDENEDSQENNGQQTCTMTSGDWASQVGEWRHKIDRTGGGLCGRPRSTLDCSVRLTTDDDDDNYHHHYHHHLHHSSNFSADVQILIFFFLYFLFDSTNEQSVNASLSTSSKFLRIRYHTLTLRWLMSYIYGAPILDVSRSHTTTQHSR